MALALRADQFERQQAGDGLRRRNHFSNPAAEP
jgi:hypothetical protein